MKIVVMNDGEYWGPLEGAMVVDIPENVSKDEIEDYLRTGNYDFTNIEDLINWAS
jgi:hypothetical protein